MAVALKIASKRKISFARVIATSEFSLQSFFKQAKTVARKQNNIAKLVIVGSARFIPTEQFVKVFVARVPVGPNKSSFLVISPRGKYTPKLSFVSVVSVRSVGFIISVVAVGRNKSAAFLGFAIVGFGECGFRTF